MILLWGPLTYPWIVEIIETALSGCLHAPSAAGDAKVSVG